MLLGSICEPDVKKINLLEILSAWASYQNLEYKTPENIYRKCNKVHCTALFTTNWSLIFHAISKNGMQNIQNLNILKCFLKNVFFLKFFISWCTF